MIQCRECGANLPDGAGACMQCGTVVERSTKSSGALANLEFVRPAIAGGLLLGLLSPLPYVNGLGFLFGGAFAAHLLLKQRSSGVTYGDGAFVGVLSGLVAAIVATILMIPIKLTLSADFEANRQAIERTFASTPEMKGPFRDLALRAISPEVSLTTEFFWFFVYGIFFSLFAMLSGMAMVGIVNRRRRKREGTQA